MSSNIGSKDLSAAMVGAVDTMDWSGQGLPAQNGPPARIQLFNESGCGLDVTLNASGRTFHLPAGGWTQDGIPLAANDRSLSYRVTSIIPNAPIAQLTGVYYGAGEQVTSVVLGNSPIGIAGNVSTTTGQSIKNDANAPATSIIEATPSDQGSSSWAMNNDGSGFLQVLSAGILRKILNVVRGNATTGKATIDIGDTNDKTITTYHGQLETISSDGGDLVSDGLGNLAWPNTPNNVAQAQGISFSGPGITPGGWYRDTANSFLFKVRNAFGAGSDVFTVDSAGNVTCNSISAGSVASATKATRIEDSSAQFGMAFNASWNGSNWVFLNGATGTAWRIFADSTNGNMPSIQFSTNASPATGATITWGPTMVLFFGFYQATQPAGGAGVPSSSLWVNSSL